MYKKNWHAKMKTKGKEQSLQDDEKPRGLSSLMATIFIVGELAGSGILTFPKAFNDLGWAALIIMPAVAASAAYTAILLSRCWVMVRHRHLEYRGHVRQPYPIIGQVAFGKTCKYLISFCVNFTCFGTCVAYLLVSSQNISSLAIHLGVHLSYCYWLVIVAAAVCALCWLGSPKDFWFIAIAAVSTTLTALALILSDMAKDAQIVPSAFHTPISPKLFLIAFGIVCLGFGGHPTFPTIQVDMKTPENFGKAVFISFLIMLGIYLPISMVGFLVYGTNLQPNVLLTISPGPLSITAQILITLHLLTGFIMLLNLVCQEGEYLLRIPHKFGTWRVFFRTSLVALVLFTALSIPQFGLILSLIGGSTMLASAFIFPPILYLKICSQKGDWESAEVSLHEKVFCLEILVVGSLAGIAATFSALEALTHSQFSKPCYLT